MSYPFERCPYCNLPIFYLDNRKRHIEPFCKWYQRENDLWYSRRSTFDYPLDIKAINIKGLFT